MFGLFASSQLKKLMLLCNQASENYNKNFEVVLEASNKALELLPQIKSWRGASPGVSPDTIFVNLIIFRTNALAVLYGRSNSDINKQIKKDLVEALRVLKPTGKDDMWAYCCIDLSLAYFESPHGLREKNIERAIHLAANTKQYYKANFSSNNKDGFARCCGNLANYYADRLYGEKRQNIEIALANIDEASLIWTKENDLLSWAKLKVHEGSYLTQYDAPDRTEKIENIIKQLEDLRNVFSRQNAPSMWLLYHEVLAKLYVIRGIGSTYDNIEHAIDIIKNAQVNKTSIVIENYLDNEAECRLYIILTHLYVARINGNKKENLSSALQFAQKAEQFCDVENIARFSSVKSLIANCELELQKIDPSRHSKEIERKLVDAIETAEILGNKVDKAHSLSKLAEYYTLVSDLGVERFEKALEIFAQIEDITQGIDPVFYHNTLVNKATMLSNRTDGNFADNSTESIKNFQIAHDYFEKGRFEDKLIQCKISMAKTLIQMHLNGIVDQDQRAIALLEQAAQSETIKNNQQQKVEIAYLLNQAYDGRISGNRAFNKKNSLELLLGTLWSLDPEKDMSLWIKALEDAIQFVIDEKNMEVLQSFKDFFEDNVFSRIDPIKFPVPWSRAKIAYARVLRRTLADTPEKYTTVVKLYKEAVESLEKSKNKNILDWAEAKFGLARAYSWWHTHDSSVDYNLAIQVYDECMSAFTPESWPMRYFRIQLELGTLFVEKELWQKADASFEKAIRCVEKYVDDGKNALRAQLLDHYSGWLLTLIPFVALINGDIRRALIYSEKFKARNLKTELDIEEYLSQQVNEQSLRAKYKEIKLAEKLIEIQADGDTQKGINQLDFLRSELELSNQGDLLSSAHREFDLDECLASLENWVFIPFIGTKHTILVLLPPGGTLEDAKISEIIPHGEQTLSSVFMGNPADTSRECWGWIQALQETAIWDAKRANAKNNANEKQEAESKFQKAAKLYETKQLILDKFLWDHYGQWIVDTVRAEDIENPVHITVIPQTILNSFSFAAASGQEDVFLLDYCEISYSPSLYAKVMLDRRAKNYINLPHLAFLPYEKLECSPLEGSLSASYFQHSTIVDIDEQKEFETVRNKLSHSNYWHFATHGKFILSEPGDSYLILSGESEEDGSNHMFRLRTLIALETDMPLRLISLSACEVGMQDFLKTPNEPLGFPTSFIQIGAIGVIAPLWSVNDNVAMLLMSRFYEYHITENYKPAAALRLSQRWLIESTVQDFVDYLGVKVSEGILPNDETIPIISGLKSEKSNKYIYDEPYYWAPFVFYGA